ncbi:hypothetical protein LOC68_00840 [Blastopirellula sp. JC732]|uniref:Uncharacterized protein n=1 Tax=Blastopirellula sediminis TaxID=2894196 RepID=A0A9X1MI15_9BACT|nr:hypothetical protein [Blastopirellula sediminis]MCC9604421.1 hypothetical protein [Blastopirellula sediminis]MCC9626941.1 hypothetical protein [Blastopirellula sediminis]
MSISVQCTQCGGSFQVADKYAGSKIRCPKCKVGVIQIAASEPLWDDGGFRLKPDETIHNAVDESPKRRGSFMKSRSARLWMHRGRVWIGSAVAACGLIVCGYYLWYGFGELDMAGREVAVESGMTPTVKPLETSPAPFNPLSGGDNFVANSQGNSSIERSMPSGTESSPTSPSPYSQTADGFSSAVQANVRPSADSFAPMTISPNTAGNSGSIAGDIENLWRGGTRMRSTIHPFEVEFPSNKVIGFPSPIERGAVLYMQRPDKGVVNRRTLLDRALSFGFPTMFAVAVGPRRPGESDQQAIQRVSHVDSTRNSTSTGEIHTVTQHEGYPALDTELSPQQSQQYQNLIHMRRRVIAHPSGIYVITAQAKGWSNAALERFITSLHFTDRAESSLGLVSIPLASGPDPGWPGYDISGQPNPQGEYILWEVIPLQ